MNTVDFILEEIDKFAPKNKTIQVLAVTKNRTVSEITPLIRQGIFLIGENRVQEAIEKFSKLSNFKIEKHLIGSLQTNKENNAIELFDVIQSVESFIQLERIINKLERKNISKRIYIQCNTSLEESKHGIRSEEELYRMIELALSNNFVKLEGLMTIGALSTEEYIVRKSFHQLACIKEKLIVQYPSLADLKLSMGMSRDFRWAIQEGSDLIRLGTILFS